MKRFALPLALLSALALAATLTRSADAAGFHLSIGGHGRHVGYYGGHHGCHRSYYPSARVWHDTSHYDFHPGYHVWHGDHTHYVPSHWDYHRTGHWDYVGW